MPISLDPKNDAPQLTSAVIAAFKKMPNVYTEDKLKTVFAPDNTENQKLIKEALEGIKQLAEDGLDPKGSNIKVGAVLSYIFPNKDVLGKLFTAFMADDFKDLQTATKADYAARKTANQGVLTAVTALDSAFNVAMGKFGELNTALAAAAAPPADPPALTRESIFTSITTAAADPVKWNALAAAIGLASTAATGDPPAYAAPTDANKGAIMDALKAAVETPPPSPALAPALTAIDAKITVDAVKTALTPPPVAEAFIRSLDLSKKLYEAGFITRSEYTGKLLETRSLLTEAGEPVPPPALNPAATAARQKLGQLAAGAGNENGLARQEIAILIAQIKGNWTKYVSEPVIVESHRRLVKAQVKHKILREAKLQGVKKEMLNEFLLAILGGILAAVAGWIGKKFGEWFKGGPAVSIVPVGPSAGVDQSNLIADALANMASMQGSYQDLKGEHGPDGKVFNRATAITKVQSLIAKLTEAQTKWVALLATCPDGTAAAATYPEPSGATVAAALTAALAEGGKINTAPTATALGSLVTYFRT
jgi:hypothetical protein